MYSFEKFKDKTVTKIALQNPKNNVGSWIKSLLEKTTKSIS